MGKDEFYAWVRQVHEDRHATQDRAVHSWDAADQDPGWQAMRAKRDKELFGR